MTARKVRPRKRTSQLGPLQAFVAERLREKGHKAESSAYINPGAKFKRRKHPVGIIPPGFYWLDAFVSEVKAGKIKIDPFIVYFYRAAREILHDKIDPAIALHLAPSNLPGHFSHDSAKRQELRRKLALEVAPVWEFFKWHRSIKKVDGFGARAKTVALGARIFHKSDRVVDRYFTAYKTYGEELELLAEKVFTGRPMPPVSNKKWWANYFRDAKKMDAVLDAAAVIAFGRSRK
jgi:hypothetical protein